MPGYNSEPAFLPRQALCVSLFNNALARGSSLEKTEGLFALRASLLQPCLNDQCVLQRGFGESLLVRTQRGLQQFANRVHQGVRGRSKLAAQAVRKSMSHTRGIQGRQT